MSLSLLFWVRHSHTNSVGVCCLCPHPKNLVRDDDDDDDEEDENVVVVVVVFVLSLARASDRDKKSATPPPPKKRELSCVASNYSRTSLRPRHHHRHRKSTENQMVDVAELKAALDKLESELEKEKQKNAQLVEENASIKAKSASLVSEMEKEEEHITNALMRRIETMSLEKKNLMLQIDAEEEHISNALQKKLDEVMKQKVDLERQLESETEFVGNKLQRQVDQLARDKKTLAKERERLRTKIQSLHDEGEKLRREKVAIEHSLETEEENIVNKLQAQIQKLLQQNVLLERKLNRLQGGNFAATSDSEQSEDGYSSTYSARAAYLSSSPRSARSGTSTRDASDGMGSRGGGHHANRGDFITSWQRGAYAAHSKENSSNKSSFTKKEKDKEEPTSESGSQRKSLDIPSGLGRMNLPPHRTLSTGGPGSTYSQSGMTEDNATNATTHGNETPMSLPTTPRSGLSSVQHPDSEND